MIRPILTELVLFLVPFVVYALYLLATRADVFSRDSWSATVVSWLTIVALVIMIASFVLLAEFSGAPPGSTYEPARLENGKLIPGAER